MSRKQISVMVSKGMNQKMEEYVREGLFSDRQEMVVSAIRNHAHILLESTAESIICHKTISNIHSDPENFEDRACRLMAKYVSASFDGSALLDVYDYHFPGQELTVRISIRIPDRLLDVWSQYANYTEHWKKLSDYVRECIVMEMLRIDEDERIRSAVKTLNDRDATEEASLREEGDLMTILQGRHGYLFNLE